MIINEEHGHTDVVNNDKVVVLILVVMLTLMLVLVMMMVMMMTMIVLLSGTPEFSCVGCLKLWFLSRCLSVLYSYPPIPC